jgi:hypothetical protein
MPPKNERGARRRLLSRGSGSSGDAAAANLEGGDGPAQTGQHDLGMGGIGPFRVGARGLRAIVPGDLRKGAMDGVPDGAATSGVAPVSCGK